MSALVRKEIRLLLPAWVAALVLVMAPIPLGELLGQHSADEITLPLSVYSVAIACLILGLTAFGREVAAHTFGLLLSQPNPRSNIWRVKAGVLLVAMIPPALFLGLLSRQFVPASERWETVLTWFVSACVAISGGLWTTLLFRQIVAAFWISMLVPFAVLVSVTNLGEEVLEPKTRTTIAAVVLLAYSIAGYWFARWQFLRAQDTAWTGGNVSFPALSRWLPWVGSAPVHRRAHPLGALFGKELQFQQINCLLAGVFLLIQIAALLLQKAISSSEHSMLDIVVQNFWGIWAIMPLLVGCGAVAEERKLGTLDSQLCLPVSRARQFTVKVLVTLASGIVLGALVPIVLACLQPAGGPKGGEFIATWTLLCAGLALVSLYASSMTQQLLQAFGAAIGILVVAFFLGNWFAGNFSRGQEEFSLLGLTLWRGPLVLIVGAGVTLGMALILAWRRWRWGCVCLVGLFGLLLLWAANRTWTEASVLTESRTFGLRSQFVILVSALSLCPVLLTLALAARNFDHSRVSFSLWRRNAGIWLACLIITGILTPLTYNRAWEIVMRFEPPAGPPRLSGEVQPVITQTFVNRATLVLLPDGRLCSYQAYEMIPRRDTGSQISTNEPVWRPISKPRVEFLDGGNWLTIAVTGREIVGVKSDGSLWRAAFHEQVDAAGKVVTLHTGSVAQKGLPIRPTGLRFDRFGNETNWVSVAAGGQHWVALKRDGTIWGWGDNSNRQMGDGPKLLTDRLSQIGGGSNWVAVFAGPGVTSAVNRENEIWRWGRFPADHQGSTYEDGPLKFKVGAAGIRAIASAGNADLILDTEGGLWGLGFVAAYLSGSTAGFRIHRTPVRIPGEDWVAVSWNWQGWAALKRDGSAWGQPVTRFLGEAIHAPRRLGRRTDWVAIVADWNSTLALGRDGTICRFGEPTLGPKPELLAPTRRVTWSLNLLDAAE